MKTIDCVTGALKATTPRRKKLLTETKVLISGLQPCVAWHTHYGIRVAEEIIGGLGLQGL